MAAGAAACCLLRLPLGQPSTLPCLSGVLMRGKEPACRSWGRVLGSIQGMRCFPLAALLGILRDASKQSTSHIRISSRHKAS